MLQGQEDGVDYDADGDGQLSERVGHHGSQGVLKAQPLGATVPYEVFGCQVFPAWEARLLGFFLFWRRRMKEQLRNYPWTSLAALCLRAFLLPSFLGSLVTQHDQLRRALTIQPEKFSPCNFYVIQSSTCIQVFILML